MSDEVRLELKDWLYNAGLVGFINILRDSKENIRSDGTEIYFKTEVLDNFEEKYFKYLIDTYEKHLSWYKVVRFEEFILKQEEDDFKNFKENELNVVNQYIGTSSKNGTLKYILSRSSYKTAYELIGNDFDIIELEKVISQIKIKKSEKIEDKIEKIRKLFTELKKIIQYFNKDNSKRYLAGKDVIYSIIKNAWDGVSFLNPQTKISDIFIDFKEYFVNPVKGYIDDDKSKYNFNCFACDRKIKNQNNDLIFLNATGFDVGKKTSHVWNHINDIVICPICKLIYSCVPAGITYISNKGIFINYNHQIEDTIRINKAIKLKVLNDSELRKIYNYFPILVQALNEIMNENVKYDLADIQLVRYEVDRKSSHKDEKYHFNLLSKNVLRVLCRFEDDLNSLNRTGFKEANVYFNLYDEAMKKLLNNENLFLLIHKVLLLKISNPQNAYYNFLHIKVLLEINNNFLKEVGIMEYIEKDIIKSSSSAGYSLRLAYKQKNSENKLDGISYRLLNALKTNNKHMFMDVLLNCYLYADKTVPVFFIECLKNDVVFKNIGYAFVSGLIKGTKTDNNNEGGN